MDRRGRPGPGRGPEGCGGAPPPFGGGRAQPPPSHHHPAVGQVVATVNGKRLLAYVVPVASVEPADLRTYSAALLPEYMVPAVIMMLDELRLSRNGKLDRKALPLPDTASRAYVAPRTE